jgi:hypothetical protein
MSETEVTMQKLVREYQRIMGWTDQSIITILCSYIEAVQPDSGAGYDSHLQEYLEECSEEES